MNDNLNASAGKCPFSHGANTEVKKSVMDWSAKRFKS